MNKFYQFWMKFTRVANFFIAFFMLIVLTYSAITSTPVETLVNWQWWLLFFGVTAWERINAIHDNTQSKN